MMAKTFASVMILTLLFVGCADSDEPSAPQRLASEGVSAAVERVRSQSDQEPDDSYFDTNQIGERFEVIGESSADFGLGFDSELIMLAEREVLPQENDRPRGMSRLLIETAPDRYEAYPVRPRPLPAGTWQLVADGKARTIESLKPALGEWNGYFFVHDHNANGVDEIVHFAASGVDYVPVIWEYQAGELKVVLDATSIVSISLLVEMPQPGSVIVYHTLLNTGEEEYLRETFQWNEQSGMYEHTLSEPAESVPN